MWSELRKSLSSIFEERITSPFFGSFIFSWLIWNWKIIYLTIFVSQDNITPSNKIDYILNNYSNWWHLLVFPFLSAIFLVTVVPWFSNRLFKIYLFYEKQRTTWREESDSKRRLTIENSAQILNDALEQELKHQKQIELKNSDIKIANEQIDRLAADKLKVQEQLIEIDKKSKEFRILYAGYGKDEKYSDVTKTVIELLATKGKFQVKNEDLGGDPIFGIHKELLILYGKDSFTQALSAKEYQDVMLQNELLTVSDTNESKNVYAIESLSLKLSSLESFFPGIWKLSYKGRLTGSEEVEIRNGNEYFEKAIGKGEFQHAFNLENISIDLEGKKIEFTKILVPPLTRNIKSSLNIVNLGQHYAGTEENGEIQVSYSKIKDPNYSIN